MRLHHVAIGVRDLERSARFYKDVLGFEERAVLERPDINAFGLYLEQGDARFEIWQFKNARQPDGDVRIGLKHVALIVDDIEVLWKRLKAGDLAVSDLQENTHGERHCFAKDPDGIQLELHERPLPSRARLRGDAVEGFSIRLGEERA